MLRIIGRIILTVLTVPRHSAAKFWKAHDGIRTRDLFLTKEVLYRLSYMGARRAQPEQFQTIQIPTTSNLTPTPSLEGRGPIAFDYAAYMERETGLEPATPSLEGSRSTN